MIAATNPDKTTAAVRSRSTAWLRQVRQLHMYLGLFFAPSIIFFAFSGALQLFSLHESHPGDQYHPPAWIQKLASIHKDQRLGQKHGPPPAAAGHDKRPEFPPRSEPRGLNKAPEDAKATMALKGFFLAMAVGLIFTTLLGVYMTFKFQRKPILVWGLLLAGTVVPAGLIALLA